MRLRDFIGNGFLLVSRGTSSRFCRTSPLERGHAPHSLYILYQTGCRLSTPFSKIFGENWRGFVLVQYGRSDLYPYAFPLYPIFFFPLRSSPMRRKRSQSGLYRALVAMSRLFVYRGVRSPLFCIYYSRWSAFCQHFF